MEYFYSFLFLLKGILKRIYWLIPALVTDPFDVLARLGVEMNVPPFVTWSLVILGFVVAITLTYHESRMDIVTFMNGYRNSLNTLRRGIVMIELSYNKIFTDIKVKNKEFMRISVFKCNEFHVPFLIQLEAGDRREDWHTRWILRHSAINDAQAIRWAMQVLDNSPLPAPIDEIVGD